MSPGGILLFFPDVGVWENLGGKVKWEALGFLISRKIDWALDWLNLGSYLRDSSLFSASESPKRIQRTKSWWLTHWHPSRSPEGSCESSNLWVSSGVCYSLPEVEILVPNCPDFLIDLCNLFLRHHGQFCHHRNTGEVRSDQLHHNRNSWVSLPIRGDSLHPCRQTCRYFSQCRFRCSVLRGHGSLVSPLLHLHHCCLCYDRWTVQEQNRNPSCWLHAHHGPSRVLALGQCCLVQRHQCPEERHGSWHSEILLRKSTHLLRYCQQFLAPQHLIGKFLSHLPPH